MDSNSKFLAFGDLISKKPNRKDGVSSAGPIKRTGQTSVSSAKTVSGDPMSKKSTSKAVVCSDVPVKRSGGTGVPSAKTDEMVLEMLNLDHRKAS